MSNIEKIESKMEDLKQMKSTLMEHLKVELTKNMTNLDTEEAGEVVDMIKDFAEVEKLCYEAEYYKTVIEAMEEESEDRYGYTRNRDSMGRFTSSNGRKGYRPYVDQMPYIEGYLNDPNFEQNRSTDGRSGTYSGGVRRGFVESEWDDKGGKAYNEYKNYRRYYTTSHSDSDKAEMEKYMKEHVKDTLDTMREIYHNAEPELKKKIKSDIAKLVDDMM